MSAKIVNVLNDMDAVRNGITDFKEGYYAMDKEPPNGKQLQSKKKINVAIEDLVIMEEEREKSAAEKIAVKDKERLGKLGPEERQFRMEITKLFLDNIQDLIDRPIEIFEKEFEDLYIGDRFTPFIQTVQKVVGKLVLKTAQELSNAHNGLDKRSMKVAKVAGKSGKLQDKEENEAQRIIVLK